MNKFGKDINCKETKNKKNIFLTRIRRKGYLLFVLPIWKQIVTRLPISGHKIVFDNFGGKGYGGNPKYIAEAILNTGKKNLELVWLVNNFMSEEERSIFPKEIRVVNNESMKGLLERATAKVWVDNVRNYHPLKKRKEQIYLQTWHGSLGAKRVEKDAEDLLSKDYVEEAKYDGLITDAIIADNCLQEQVYRRAFWLNSKTEVLRFGFPQNDIIQRERQDTAKIEQLKQAFSMSNQVYYVLYAPTFRDDLSTEGYQIDFERVIEAFEKKVGKKVNIIIRLHPNVAFQKKEMHFSERILDGTDYPNIQDLALVCDALISDYSSTLFDFSMMNKPAFICALDYEEYERKRGFVPEFYEFPFPITKSNDELVGLIQDFDIEKYKSDVKCFYDKYPTYCDGHSAAKVCEWILEQLE